MEIFTTKQTTVLSSSLRLEDLANAAPLRATEAMPTEIAELLKPDSGLYIRSETKPTVDVGVERVPGSDDIWRVIDYGTKGELRTTLPGLKQTELQPEQRAEKPSVSEAATESHRPPWVEQHFLPRLAPYSLSARDSGLREDRMYLEPRAQEAERLPYPWRTIGRIIARSSLGTWV